MTTATSWTTPVKKMNFYFTNESRDTLKSFSLFFFTVKTEYGTRRQIRNRNLKNYPSSFTFSKQRKVWSFHFAEDAKRFTKIYNVRAEPLLCSFNLLFCDVPVPVAVVVFLNSLIFGSRS